MTLGTLHGTYDSEIAVKICLSCYWTIRANDKFLSRMNRNKNCFIVPKAGLSLLKYC